MAITEEQLAELFFAESEELLSAANEALLTAEAAGTPDESVSVLFRAFHSIKGGAMSMELTDLAELAHRLEDLLDLARQGAIAIDGQVVNLVFASIDSMDGLLKAYGGKACSTDAAEATRLELMEEIAQAIAAKSSSPTPSSVPAVSAAPKIKIDPAKRLAYCEVRLAEKPDMPEIRMMLILKRLEDIGQIVYSYPEAACLMTGAHESDRLVKAILATDASDAAIVSALDMADVIGRRVLDVATGGLPEGDLTEADLTEADLQWPAEEAVGEFQQLVDRLAESLVAGDDGQQAVQLCEELSRWGEAAGLAEAWFPGGLAAWQGLTGLLAIGVESSREQPGNAALLRQVQEGLGGLWQSVFGLLCGVRYYRRFQPQDCPLEMALDEIVAQVLANKRTRLALLDCSAIHTLEKQDIQAFVKTRSFLAEQGVKLALFAGGQAGRRHQNVLEALNEAAAGLTVRSTGFEAGWRRQTED